MSIMKEIEKLQNEVRTENGDVAYRSTFNKNLDFFGLAGAMRGRMDKALELFEDAFDEDAKLALANLFHLRNVRGGIGERDLFRVLFTDMELKGLEKALPFVVKYGRWDDVVYIAQYTKLKKVAEAAYDLIQNQLKEDIENRKKGNSVSLLGNGCRRLTLLRKKLVIQLN